MIVVPAAAGEAAALAERAAEPVGELAAQARVPARQVVLAAELPVGVRRQAQALPVAKEVRPLGVYRQAVVPRAVKAAGPPEACPEQALAVARAERREVYLPAPELAVAKVAERVNRELERQRVRRATKPSHSSKPTNRPIWNARPSSMYS